MKLTRRETQIVRAICLPDSKNLKEIAYDLNLATGTLKTHLSRLYKKTGAGSARMLLLWAITHRDELGIDLPEVWETVIPNPS